MNRVQNQVLALAGMFQAAVVVDELAFSGNYTEYEEDRRKRLGAEADRPHRIKYRKLGA